MPRTFASLLWLRKPFPGPLKWLPVSIDTDNSCRLIESGFVCALRIFCSDLLLRYGGPWLESHRSVTEAAGKGALLPYVAIYVDLVYYVTS